MNARFNRVLGTGGIGSGVLWALDSDRILERNESRPAKMSKVRDYCKQHIILHYLARVMADDAQVYAIGKVGDDDNGRMLYNEMQNAGIHLDYVEAVKHGITMYSMCIQYPDFQVCNVTTSNSVCNEVDSEYVKGCLGHVSVDERTAIIAVPEVPLSARMTLLAYGNKHRAFCTASVLYDEVDDFLKQDGLSLCDLLVINEIEANAFLKKEIEGEALAYEFARMPGMHGHRVAITCGEQGSFTIEDQVVAHTPARKAEVASTAGAGDAFTAGLVCGLHFGLSFHSGAFSAADFATAFAAKSVECIHTIAPTIDRDFARFLLNNGF